MDHYLPHKPPLIRQLARATPVHPCKADREARWRHFTEMKRLPAGVTEADAELFNQARTAATAASVPEEPPEAPATPPPAAPAAPAATPATPAVLHVAPRCPSAIEFGQWEIETWYSSPFPQEYAR